MMSRRRVIAAGVLIVAAWAAAVVADRGVKRSHEKVRAAVPSAVTPDLGTARIPRNPLEVLPGREPTPVRLGLADPPRAGLLFDVGTGRVLWQLHPQRRLPIASLTKMLTALIIAERHRLREHVL